MTLGHAEQFKVSVGRGKRGTVRGKMRLLQDPSPLGQVRLEALWLLCTCWVSHLAASRPHPLPPAKSRLMPLP